MRQKTAKRKLQMLCSFLFVMGTGAYPAPSSVSAGMALAK